MDRQKTTGFGIFVILLICIFNMLLTINASAQTVLTADSNTSLGNISYMLNTSELGLNTTYMTMYDNTTDTTTMINITNSINYTCALSITGLNVSEKTYVQNNLTGDINDVIIITQPIDTISDGSYGVLLNCSYDINTTNHITIITPYFDNVTNQTYNVTSNMPLFGTSQVNISISKGIKIDTLPPLIILNYPSTTANGTNQLVYINDSNSKDGNGNVLVSVPFNFTLYDASQLNCTLTTDTLRIYSSGAYNSSAAFMANSSTIILPLNLSVPTNISSGNYTYSLSCSDALGNIAIANASLQLINNIPAPETISFDIQVSKSGFNLGEIGYYTINAVNNSNVTITICPIASGWVQCYMTPPYVNYTFPIVQALPYTNKTGAYVIQGVMRYKNYTIMTNTTYNTVNTLTASIAASSMSAGNGDIIIFNATAGSGIGSYTYKWIMHDGSVFNGPGAYKNYTTAGYFPVNLSVNDSQGNQYNTSVYVTIKNYYNLAVVAVDKDSNARIAAAEVSIDNNDDTSELTDNNGAAYFRLLDGSYDIYVSKSDYGRDLNEVTLNNDATIFFNMSFSDTSAPKVTLLTDNDVTLSNDSVSLKFKAEDQSNVLCAIYTAPANYGWYTLQDSGDNLQVNTEYTFELHNLSLGAYKWRVECTDKDNNKGSSEERNFTISDTSVQSYLESSGTNSDDINTALDNMNKLSGEESDVADILNVRSDLKDLLDRINRMDKDIHDTSYRRDLNATGIEDAQKNITASIEYLKYNTPISLKISDSKTFVKYVKDPEIKTLVDDYAGLKNMNIDKGLFLESTRRAQSKAIISTRVRNIVLYYLDGNTKEITLVTRDIKVAKPEDDAALSDSKTVTFVEVIPKTIIQSAKEMHVLNADYTILKEDPLIELPPTTRMINYYIDKNVNLEDLEQADTVIIDKNTQGIKSTTGFAILGIGNISNIQIDGQGIMIIIIVLLLLFYVVMHFNVIDKLRGLGLGSKKKVSYIKVLINDSLDYLSVDDYEKAALIYREIKLSYENANSAVRKQVYDDSYELCNKLDMNYSVYLLDKIESYIKQQNRNAAFLELEKLAGTFDKMDKRYQDQISARFHDIYNKIKALGE
jgi:hypothetical protein